MLIGNSFEELFNGIFKIVTELAGSIMVAPISLITSFFPDLTQPIRYVTTYLTTCLTYVPLVLDLLMIPRSALIYLFNYYIAKAFIYMVTRMVRLILNVYNKLKV